MRQTQYVDLHQRFRLKVWRYLNAKLTYIRYPQPSQLRHFHQMKPVQRHSVCPNGSGIVRSLLVQEVSSPSVSLGASGAFSGFSDGASMALRGNAKDGYFDSFDMDLSRSSTIFGASTRVQPKAFNLLMIIKN